MPPTTPPLPEHVTVFVNWACNLRCRECWLYGDSADENGWLSESVGQRLPLATFERLIDELLADTPTTSISLMGGEPLLHPDRA
jgi:organic radical activating enzyme